MVIPVFNRASSYEVEVWLSLCFTKRQAVKTHRREKMQQQASADL